MPGDADFSFHQARAYEELDAACRSTLPEETELHLRLAWLHLQQRSDKHFIDRLPAPSPDQRRRAIYHTDKEG